MQLDDVDAAILAALQKDARLSFREVADRVGVSTPTVSARVKRLEDLGVIRAYRAILGDGLRGDHVHVLRVRARPADLAVVAARVQELAGVEEVLHLAGGLLEARVRLPRDGDVAEILRDVSTIPEVQEYEERRVLNLDVVDAPAPARERADVQCHECKGPVHGQGVTKRLGDRHHAFCCRNCLATFEARWEKRRGAT